MLLNELGVGVIKNTRKIIQFIPGMKATEAMLEEIESKIHNKVLLKKFNLWDSKKLAEKLRGHLHSPINHVSGVFQVQSPLLCRSLQLIL